MELKTAEEVFNQFVNIRTVGDEVAKNIIDAMKEYAEQEVKKHLEIASENAKICEHPNQIKGSNQIDFQQIGDALYFETYIWIDKQSITNIKIELT